MLRAALVISLAVLIVACDRNNVAPADNPLTPVAPSDDYATTSAGATIGSRATQGREDVVVNMQDACDPDTFNAALQRPDACVRAGGVKFDQFIAELTRLGFIGPWHFAPSTANVRVGQTFVATNKGGETHTFTEVADFGGGIVPLLNDLARVPNMAPECAPDALEPDDFVPPGGTYREAVDHARTPEIPVLHSPVDAAGSVEPGDLNRVLGSHRSWRRRVTPVLEKQRDWSRAARTEGRAAGECVCCHLFSVRSLRGILNDFSIPQRT